MNIGFDGSRAFVKYRTGTENYSFELLKNLAKLDTLNEYLVYIRPGNEVNSKDWPANFKFKKIDLPYLWTQYGLAAETFLDKLDVLFVPAHTLPLIRRPGLKTVMTVHDLGSEYLPGLHQLKQRLYLSFITKVQLKSATRLIAVSQATKQDLIDKVGVSKDRVEVIYEGLNDLKPAKNPAAILKRHNLKPKEYLLFVGTIQPRKNLERLIKAFQLFVRGGSERSERGPRRGLGADRTPEQSLKLVLVGGRGWMSDEIYQLPKKLRIEDRVKFLGRVPDGDLGALYQGAKAFVFPSLFEGFGLPILEAFSASCPVLTSNLSSTKEISGDAAILIDPYDIDSIVSGLRKVLKEGESKKLITKGLKRVKDFSWQKAAKETLDLLTKVANQ